MNNSGDISDPHAHLPQTRLPRLFDASIKLDSGQRLFWLVLGILAAQRFSMPTVAAYVCLVPLVLGVLQFRASNSAKRNTYILLAIFFSIDTSVGETGVTPDALRRTIYIVALASMLYRSKININALILVCIAGALYILNTYIRIDSINSSQLFRDMTTFILVATIISTHHSKNFELNLTILFFAILGYLLSDLFNFIFLKSAWIGSYMSYDTTKYLVITPSVIALFRRQYVLAIAISTCTVLVLIGYTSRNIFLLYLIFVVVFMAYSSLVRSFSSRSLFALLIASIIFAINTTEYHLLFERYKALNAILLIEQYGLNAFAYLDPVRYRTAELFFQISLPELLFGRGFGSGIEDSSGLLAFVRADQAAFTEEELTSRYFYNFHDIWVDVGLRFGLLPLGAFLVWVFRRRPAGNSNSMAIWIIALFGILLAFYSVAGLLTAFIALKAALASRVDNAS